jgi:hypothetical protein
MPAPLISEYAYPHTPAMSDDKFISRKTMQLSFEDAFQKYKTVTIVLSDVEPGYSNVNFTIEDFEDGFNSDHNEYTLKFSTIRNNV